MVALLVIIITCFLLEIISSKTSKSLKIESEVPISKWSFTVNNKTEEIQKINLFESNIDTNHESRLAPGTSGSFTIFLDATEAEVDLEYQIISVEEINKPHNLKFIFNEKEYDSFKQMEEVLSGTINVDDVEKTRTFQINWEWKYETGNTKEEIDQNDIIDTEDMNNIKNYNFVICVSGEQVKL